MRIKLKKNWRKPSGKVIPKGRDFFVTNKLGNELIKKGYAKYYKDPIIDIFAKKSKIEFETKDEHLKQNKNGNNRNS